MYWKLFSTENVHNPAIWSRITDPFPEQNILIVPTVRRVGGTEINAGMFCVARLCEYHSAVTHVSHLLPPPPNMKFEE